MSTHIIVRDCLEALCKLPDESVHCVVTSPPYWGLRDYGTAKWEGGDPDCGHRQGRPGQRRADGIVDDREVFARNRDGAGAMGGDCLKCGARRIDSQIGLEPSFQDYLATMVKVFREVRRVLRKDGTLWLNMGDSYATGAGAVGQCPGGGKQGENWQGLMTSPNRMPQIGLKAKDLCGIPWRLAFALQADGWYLRSDIIWHKPNPMPESVTDRPTKAHEYVFLMSKSERYFYDAEAVREPAQYGRRDTAGKWRGVSYVDQKRGQDNSKGNGGFNSVTGKHPETGRNRRTVWTIPTAPFPEAHFATFPPALVEPCILAGCPHKCCATCGAPWVRETESKFIPQSETGRKNITGQEFMQGWEGIRRGITQRTTLDFLPSCSCDAETIPGTVLDPFGGAGTTALIAERLGREAILIELNPQYAVMAERRLRDSNSSVHMY